MQGLSTFVMAGGGQGILHIVDNPCIMGLPCREANEQAGGLAWVSDTGRQEPYFCSEITLNKCSISLP